MKTRINMVFGMPSIWRCIRNPRSSSLTYQIDFCTLQESIYRYSVVLRATRVVLGSIRLVTPFPSYSSHFQQSFENFLVSPFDDGTERYFINLDHCLVYEAPGKRFPIGRLAVKSPVDVIDTKPSDLCAEQACRS